MNEEIPHTPVKGVTAKGPRSRMTTTLTPLGVREKFNQTATGFGFYNDKSIGIETMDSIGNNRKTI